MAVTNKAGASPGKRSLLKWAKSRKGQQTLIILAFAIIPLILLFTFTYLPFGEMVKFSFYKMKYATPPEKRVFVGL
ncbi:MAG: sugar ABC transporter permease, partial [Roseburia sp.]|nr:sugar ABC transporter permease [Roseburia sp.]